MGRRHYFVTAPDLVSKFAWVTLAKSPSSRQTLPALKQFTKHYPHTIRAVQTDNGSEFLGEFDQYLEGEEIKHEFIYPRSPKINGYIERFNRTFKEEFLYKHELDICLEKFNEKLTKCLIWYNTRRPHRSLKMRPPAEYLQEFG